MENIQRERELSEYGGVDVVPSAEKINRETQKQILRCSYCDEGYSSEGGAGESGEHADEYSCEIRLPQDDRRDRNTYEYSYNSFVLEMKGWYEGVRSGIIFRVAQCKSGERTGRSDKYFKVPIVTLRMKKEKKGYYTIYANEREICSHVSGDDVISFLNDLR